MKPLHSLTAAGLVVATLFGCAAPGTTDQPKGKAFAVVTAQLGG